VDEFVILDSVQFTKNDWRNRNRIKNSFGAGMAHHSDSHGRCFPRRRISEAEVADSHWPQRHWRTLAQNYATGSAVSRARAGAGKDL